MKNMKVANVIKSMRVDREMTQTELAKAVGVYQATVSKWEKGQTPGVYTIVRIAEAFGIDFDDLMRVLFTATQERP